MAQLKILVFVVMSCVLGCLSYEQSPRCRTYPSCTSEESSTSCDGGHVPCSGGRLSCDPSGSCCCIKFDPDYTHLTTGAPKPLLIPKRVRAYLTRYCPNTHGVMLVAKTKNISLDAVYVNLDNRPEWLENELGGFQSLPVPIIELDDGTLIRTLVLGAEFLDEAYPTQGELHHSDPAKRIKDTIIIDEFDKMMIPLFRDIVYGSGLKNPQEAPGLIRQFEDGITRLGEELNRRGTKFFDGNEQPGMLDLMIWPWYERKPVIQLFYPTAFDYGQTSVRMISWSDEMKQIRAVKSLGLAIQIYYEYYLSFRNGKRDFNILSGL